MKKAAGWTIVCLALIGAGFVYWYFFWRAPAADVEVAIAKPSRVLLGEPFALTASYRNGSEQALRNAKLVMVLPTDISALGEPADRRVIEKSVGDLAPGPGNLGTFRFIATDEPRRLAEFEVRLRYSVTDDSGSQVETKTVVAVAIGEPAAPLNITAPAEAVAGEPFTVTVEYRNDSREVLQNAKLVASYPAAFQFSSALPDAAALLPGESGREWSLGTLPLAATGTVVITGSLRPGEPSAPIAIALTAEFEGRSYPVSRQAATVRAAPSQISLTITANGTSTSVVSPGDRITYELRYRNNASVPLANIALRASLSGTLFDYRSVESGGGVFNSVANTISWNSAAVPELTLLAPGAEGRISFSVVAHRDITLRRISDKHFTLKVRGDIASPTVPAGVAGTTTSATATLETKIAGRTELQALALYYEPAASSIANTGPFPPRVDRPTRFTIRWKLKNYWNDIADVRVTAKLGQGVRFTGTTSNTAGTPPAYNAVTGEVVWEVPKIAATAGILSPAPEAVFQIEVTPAVNQVGRTLLLLDRTSMTATDAFTGRSIAVQAEAKTTDLRDDPRASALGRGDVQP